jgi:DNA/RNA endonuclease YhcR with UshA esterase domain
MKHILILFLTILFISCGKKEEPEYVDQPDRQAGEKQPTTQSVQDEKKDTTKQNTQEQKPGNKKPEENKIRHEPVPEKTITALEAGDNVGKVVIVKGFVAEVHKTENVEYLNFVEKFPNNPFSGVIFKDQFDEFGDINIYSNKEVELTGRISTFKGKPQIILDSKSQIKVSK